MTKKEIIKNLKSEFNGRLEKRVLQTVLNEAKYNDYRYNKNDNFKEQLQNVISYYSHGCSTGCVSELIYYTQTEKWFNNYKKEILNLLNEFIQNGCFEINYNYEKGCYCIAIDKECIKVYNNEVSQNKFTQYEKNILAWLSFEYVLSNIENYLYNMEV